MPRTWYKEASLNVHGSLRSCWCPTSMGSCKQLSQQQSLRALSIHSDTGAVAPSAQGTQLTLLTSIGAGGKWWTLVVVKGTCGVLEVPRMTREGIYGARSCLSAVRG